MHTGKTIRRDIKFPAAQEPDAIIRAYRIDKPIKTECIGESAMENEKRYLNPNKDAIRLIARKSKIRGMFDIYIKYDKSDWMYLMAHRKNAQIYSLLNNEITLNRLHDASHKLVTYIAVKGNNRCGRNNCTKDARRKHSQQIEHNIRYLISRACSFVKYETESA